MKKNSNSNCLDIRKSIDIMKKASISNETVSTTKAKEEKIIVMSKNTNKSDINKKKRLASEVYIILNK